MKKHYIAVITMDTGVIQDMFVFPVTTNEKKSVEEAETKFRECVKELDDDVSDEDMETYLEDGYDDPTGGKEVYIVWSSN